MAVYANSKHDATIRTVEFTRVTRGNVMFLQLDSTASTASVKQWLVSVGQEVLAESTVRGHPMLVTRGHRPQEHMLAMLAMRGERMELLHKDKKMDPWIVRSLLGFGGQSLQLVSSFMRPGGKVDSSVFVFAAANLTANLINFIYKGQDVPDPHQLKHLKQQFNDVLAPDFTPGEVPLNPDDTRSALREQHKPKHVGNGFHDFMQKNSVNVGELGLRYLGAFGLAFPARQWGSALKNMQFPPMETSKLRAFAGISSIFGKSVALSSKIPDPYNPKRTWLDNVREKFTFVAGGWIETLSFSALAYDCFFNTGAKNPQRSISWNGKIHRDWLGGIGASMFVTGYIVRAWAKYGERHVDMDELYAHVSDTLAKVPPEKLPQLVADAAARISEHFHGKQEVDYGTVYTQLATDLYRYHHLAVGAANTIDMPQEPAAQPSAITGHSSKLSANAPENQIVGPIKAERQQDTRILAAAAL